MKKPQLNDWRVNIVFAMSVAEVKSRLAAAQKVAKETAIKWLRKTTAKKVKNCMALASKPQRK